MKPTAGLSILGCDVLALFGFFAPFFFPFSFHLHVPVYLNRPLFSNILRYSHLSFLLTIRVYMKSSHVYSQTTVAFYIQEFWTFRIVHRCVGLCYVLFSSFHVFSSGETSYFRPWHWRYILALEMIAPKGWSTVSSVNVDMVYRSLFYSQPWKHSFSIHY